MFDREIIENTTEEAKIIIQKMNENKKQISSLKETIRPQLDLLEEENEQLETQLIQIIKSAIGYTRKDKPWDRIIWISKFWRCKKSPVGYCAYNMHNPLRDDDCVFCHEPNERK